MTNGGRRLSPAGFAFRHFRPSSAIFIFSFPSSSVIFIRHFPFHLIPHPSPPSIHRRVRRHVAETEELGQLARIHLVDDHLPEVLLPPPEDVLDLGRQREPRVPAELAL